MRSVSRFDRYLELPQIKRRKMAIQWCFRFLDVNLDRMSDGRFVKLVTEYESIVAYPEISHGRWLFQDEEEAKSAFNGYQKIARKFIDAVRKVSPGSSLYSVECDVSRSLKVSSRRDGTISIKHKIDHDFEFSFAWHLARFLDGKKFDDAVCVCPNCNHYFPILTNHKKKYCSRGCAVKDKQRKRREKDPEKERRINKLRTQFTRIKEKCHTDEEICKELNKYLAKKPYNWDEIPQSIKDLYSNSKSTFVSIGYKGN